jgi:hypothetical protein
VKKPAKKLAENEADTKQTTSTVPPKDPVAKLTKPAITKPAEEKKAESK